MRSIPLRLPPGSDLYLSLENLGKEQGEEGYILGIVGNLSIAVFQCPNKSAHTRLEGNLEIITLNGTISPKGVHLHLSISDSDCKVWGGHLEVGSKVLKNADVLLGFHQEQSNVYKFENSETVNNNSTRLTIAVLSNCPWSAKALYILNRNKVPHLINHINNDDDFNLLKQKSNNSTFPQLFFDGQFIGGYDELINIVDSGKIETLR